MSTYQELLALANEAAEISSIDMSETSTGGQGKRLLPAGWAIGTLVEVVELGKHLGEYQGKPKKQADAIFRLGFALTGAPHYLNEDGTPYIFRTYDLSLGNNEKSKSKIAFDRMNYLQTAKHFAQLLGKSFLVEIQVTKGKKDATKEFNSINYATINKPFDPMSGNPYPTPALDTLPFKLFLWDKPTKEGWDSIFIAGEHEGKSKNYLQEICLKAVNFPGSALEQLIGGALPDITAPAALTNPSPAVPSTTALPQVSTPPVLPGMVAIAEVPVVAPAALPTLALPTIPALPGVA